MSPNTIEISPLAELAPSFIPKIPSVSRMRKTFLMAYGLIFKTIITNIISVLLKILIILNIIATVRFGSTLTFLTSWVFVFMLPCFSNLSSLSHVPHHKIHPLHHLRHALHLELKFYIRRGWCVVLISHDSTFRLVVKKILTSLEFRLNTLNPHTLTPLISPFRGTESNTK